MRDWRFWKKGRGVTASGPSTAAEPDALGGDDWSFLRTQPDHDADEMARVHGPGEVEFRPEPDSGPDLAAEDAGVPLDEVDDETELPVQDVLECDLSTEDESIGSLLRE